MSGGLLITVDGEASTGKTALSVYVAEFFGLNFLNSGALYRSMAYLKIHMPHLTTNACLDRLQNSVEINVISGAVKIQLDHEDVTDELMRSDVAALASKIATDKEIRLGLVAIQHSFFKGKGLVAEGRDMGSIIFPEADLKIYFTAPFDIRVDRRYEQLKNLGQDVDKDQLAKQMRVRDDRDRSREHSPLVIPDSALIFDTSSGTLEENKRLLVDLIAKRQEL